MNKQYLVPVLIVGSLSAAAVGTSLVSAATNSTYPPIVQKLATHFGLKEADVQAVFDQEKADHLAQMKDHVSQALDQAVTDGKITAAQKQLILDKMTELEQQRQTERANLKNLSPAGRRAAMEKDRQSLEDWAKANDIDLKNLPLGLGRPFLGGHRGHEPHMMEVGPDQKTANQTS